MSKKVIRPGQAAFSVSPDVAEPIMVIDAKLCEFRVIGDRFGEWMKRPGVAEYAIGSVCIVELLLSVPAADDGTRMQWYI